jgi:hypothetical protein
MSGMHFLFIKWYIREDDSHIFFSYVLLLIEIIPKKSNLVAGTYI